MKFITNTKPLVDSVDLGVVNANISKYNSRTCTAQITATKDKLIINLESESVYTQITLHGSGDEDIVSMAKGKRLKQFILFNERKDEIIKYALPQMLEKANGDGEPVDYEKKSSEIISFAGENEVNEFFDGVWEMIVSGFTIRERDKKKKVSFSIK